MFTIVWFCWVFSSSVRNRQRSGAGLLQDEAKDRVFHSRNNAPCQLGHWSPVSRLHFLHWKKDAVCTRDGADECKAEYGVDKVMQKQVPFVSKSCYKKALKPNSETGWYLGIAKSSINSENQWEASGT